ncbi:N-acetylmuramoyl-L-alanine amidase [Brevibacterium sp. Marseille-P9724]|uniref:N-acetylmuramoyl-L-alanine amidase n=1 Tax=Brevibacterium sp. Marseille-P9724 TaxID=2614125 RepID=UPI00125EACF9|nr:N-acetylmuramoyl-L-alanine amidase [Brevibacterium sp. Marseille-P9724]
MLLRSPALAAALCAVLLTGCAGSTPGSDTSSAPAGSNRAQSSPTPDEDAQALAGTTIAVDPGHNGGNMKNASKISRQVDDGRGGTKACNTTGTTTSDGFPEHEFAWKVAEHLRTALEDSGARVIMSRKDDKGIGPCVDERGKFAAEADVLVSIHANGSDSTKPFGFGAVIAPDRKHAESKKLAGSLVKGLKGADFRANPSYGKNTVMERKDLGGLNHATVPAVLMELGEMRNPEESKIMKTDSGRKRYADGLVAGLADYFKGRG